MGYDEKQEKCIIDVKISNGTASKTNKCSHNDRTSRIFGAKWNLYLKSIQWVNLCFYVLFHLFYI